MLEQPNGILIIGGTFDPTHRGHIEPALFVKEKLNLQRLVFCPTGVSPHKKNKKVTHPEIRKLLLEKSIEGIDGVEVDPFEQNCAKVTFFYETLAHLVSRFGPTRYFFVVGTDWAGEVHKWRNYSFIRKIATPVVMVRAGFPITDANTIAEEKYQVLEVPELDVSGTELRDKLVQGLYDDEKVKSMIAPAALEIIRQRRLYENGNATLTG